MLLRFVHVNWAARLLLIMKNSGLGFAISCKAYMVHNWEGNGHWIGRTDRIHLGVMTLYTLQLYWFVFVRHIAIKYLLKVCESHQTGVRRKTT